MAGVLMAVVRGVEDDTYLERCVSSWQPVATPLAPAEAQRLVARALRPVGRPVHV